MSNSQDLIAVIDDDPEVRAAVASLLFACGYRAHTFDSAETFLVSAPACRARCLIVDIQLADLTGIELARQLAADGFDFPIIFMTGRDDATSESQAIAESGIAFLRKTIPAEVLINAIKRAVGAK